MKAPITAGSLWMKTDAKQDFTIAIAPLAKSTHLKHLTEEIASWYVVAEVRADHLPFNPTTPT